MYIHTEGGREGGKEEEREKMYWLPCMYFWAHSHKESTLYIHVPTLTQSLPHSVSIHPNNVQPQKHRDVSRTPSHTHMNTHTHTCLHSKSHTHTQVLYALCLSLLSGFTRQSFSSITSMIPISTLCIDSKVVNLLFLFHGDFFQSFPLWSINNE